MRRRYITHPKMESKEVKLQYKQAPKDSGNGKIANPVTGRWIIDSDKNRKMIKKWMVDNNLPNNDDVYTKLSRGEYDQYDIEIFIEDAGYIVYYYRHEKNTSEGLRDRDNAILRELKKNKKREVLRRNVIGDYVRDLNGKWIIKC
jgi:hypothetical protein